MQTKDKLIKLLTQKYNSHITIYGNYEKNKNTLLLDSNSETLFTIQDDFLFSFKDKDHNSWSTIPKEVYVNGTKIYPNLGDSITRSDGVKHCFTTKENVIEMAVSYFEKFIIPYYGLKVNWRVCHFQEMINGTKYSYKLSEIKFKSSSYKEIEAYISSN
ncbi:hypothetical protein IRZ71_10035 [Flavobacterium sp. ANB]|uniref:hypothetical protein n=1 Tax=unclassified Flavobacterium TaxID=196869 RepID=UPI0012B78F4D|nr:MULTISPECIES: hypothetical protein [unclassified Flavobacterium]MBF4516686.1 hypothetical protein [Flavobacterium sp. ANB]MTD69418.1 hypothetical protein [Flavobacterium sp. LC2016-13]